MNVLGISDEAFANLNQSEQEEAKRLHKEIIQWHHDMYIALLRAGLITPDQQEDLDLAQRREQEGEVDPLEEGRETEVLGILSQLNEPGRDHND